MTEQESQGRSADERLAKLGTLFGGFAHEVRNSLSTIGLNLSLIKEDFKESESVRDRRTYKRLSVLESEVKRLQSILESFLRYVRQPELQKRPTELNTMVQSLVEFTVPEAQDKGVSLRFFPGQDVGAVDLDADLIRAVVVNLLRNAREACSKGDQIMVSTARKSGGPSGAQVQIQVTDTGPGMEPEVLQKAFTPYFSTKKGGNGLGLAISQRIAEQHGGKLELSSEPGKGTQFILHLPVVQALGSSPTSGETDES